MGLFHGLLSLPSWQSFSRLAGGWALASDRHTLTTSLWLTGATTRKHFARFYVLLGGPLSPARWHLWAQILRHAALWGPQDRPIVLALDDFTKKKAGRHIAGLARYRHSAGSARQESRTLRGVHCVLGVLRLPLGWGPGHRVTLPMGLELYLKAPVAATLRVGYRSRSPLARAMVDCVAQTLPERPMRVLADGGYATKDFVRDLPPSVPVVSRLLSSAQLYAAPIQPRQRHPGRPPRKGPP